MRIAGATLHCGGPAGEGANGDRAIPRLGIQCACFACFSRSASVAVATTGRKQFRFWRLLYASAQRSYLHMDQSLALLILAYASLSGAFKFSTLLSIALPVEIHFDVIHHDIHVAHHLIQQSHLMHPCSCGRAFLSLNFICAQSLAGTCRFPELAAQ